MALKDIKSKIAATKRTHKVTRAMEAVSAAKMRKTQGLAFADRPYALAALSILARFAESGDLAEHPLMRASERGRIALVLVTSDKGLAGALNSGVIKATADVLAVHAKEDITLFTYGKKGHEHFARAGYEIARATENKRDDIEIGEMEAFVAELSRDFAHGVYREVLVAYSNFKSTFEQVPTVRRLLPLSREATERIVADIVPEKGRWSMGNERKKAAARAEYTIEAETDDILNTLAPRLVAVSLYHLLLEAKASEHSARMVAMKQASDKSREITHDLTRLYNKRRQAAITSEVSEIIGGREALAE